MYNNKNRLFKELLNNIDDNFQKKEELISLHKENNVLASNIKIRKEIEKPEKIILNMKKICKILVIISY